jgi:N-ethylmaleimide reductase
LISTRSRRDRATFYGGEEKGSTDYPVYDELTPV